MRSRDVTSTLEALIEQKLPAFLWGAPGIGKSSIIRQIAARRQIGFIDLRLTLMDPTDLKGIPFFDAEHRQAFWAPPAFLPTEGEGILFLDELNTAAPSVQASAYQLILDRRVGEYALPEGWAIVAAGNRENDRGVVYRMPLPLANRFVHLEMEVDVRDWREWAIASGIDPRIIAYIGVHHEALFTFDPKSDAKSFATPRSWAFVDGILRTDLPPEQMLRTIGGAIGDETAVDFIAFTRVMHTLPDADAILQGDFPASVNDDVNTQHALSGILVRALLRYPGDRDAALEHLLRFTLTMPPEFAVLTVQDLQRSGVRMDHLDTYGAWVRQFGYLI